ncbi:MAG: hypothetical protein E7561_03380 [Ruminococcaceae bacterium]|nr:hypothetical protein [Oscillospiraceae bacterium]
MKKFLLLLVLTGVIICLCSCKENNTEKQNTASDFKIIMPKDDSVNGYKTGNPLTEQSDNYYKPSSSDGYFINTSTKKFHLYECTYAKRGSANGSDTNKSRDQLLNEGYSPCKKCNP